MRKKQKDVFLDGEGDAYFERNHSIHQGLAHGSSDPLVAAIINCLGSWSCVQEDIKLLEVGCGEGKRLQWLANNTGLHCYGVEPSAKAVAIANSGNVQVMQGTAERLDFEDQEFDFLVYGFCLYLADREDLFQIAKEADRVLKPNVCVVIRDFYAETPLAREYHHFPGIYSYKMDYRRLFDWNPDYTCLSHSISAHEEQTYTDDRNEWVATSVIRKKTQDD